MKKVIFLLMLAAVLLQFPVSAQVPIRVHGWPHISNAGRWPNYKFPLIATEDNQQFLFYATASGGLDKYLMDGFFAPGWPVIMDTMTFVHQFPIVDIDHDGKYEMVTDGIRREGGYRYSLIYVVDDNGSIMDGFPVRVLYESALNVADMDGDNEYEILYYSTDEQIVNCLDHYGHPKPGWPVTLPISDYTRTSSTEGSIGDLDLDGFNEYIISVNQDIFAFRYDGTMQPGFPIVTPDSSFVFYNNMTAPALGDLDSDGYPEIITTGHNLSNNPEIWFVAVYNHLGNPKRGWPKYWINQIILNTPVPSDITGDGIPEIGIEYDSTMTFMDVNGNTLPGFPTHPEGPKYCRSDFITIDINGDGYCEIFTDDYRLFPDSVVYDTVYYGYGYLYGIDHLGHDIPGYPIILRGTTFNRPPSFALDPMIKHLYMALVYNITLSSDTLRIDLFQFPDSTGPTTQWPMKNHDLLLTRNYNFVDRVTSIKNENEIILPKECILKQNYPNPFNGNTIVEFVLPKEEEVSLSVYDILGRKVTDVISGRLKAGPYRENINLSNASSGVYFCVLQTEKSRVTRKMMLVK